MIELTVVSGKRNDITVYVWRNTEYMCIKYTHTHTCTHKRQGTADRASTKTFSTTKD